VWIVAIDAGHRAFGQSVLVGLLKTGPDSDVAPGALLIDIRGFAGH
jgi:hypothetical protein